MGQKPDLYPPTNKRQKNLPKTYHLPAFGIFILLAVLVTYPIVINLSTFFILSAAWPDEYLQSWILAWDAHAILSGYEDMLNIWNANIFYPYPTTLAYNEHLLGMSLLLMPFVLLGKTPLVAHNLGILLTIALSGWGTYLLVLWLTKNPWASLVAGILFAISPFRLSNLTELNLLSTHWIPFAFLAAGLLIKHNCTKDLILLILFTNLQLFSAINYAVLVSLGLIIWTMFLLFAYRNQLSLSLLTRLIIFGAITFILNWPVLQVYQGMSEQMGVIRTLGDAKVYGASLVNYILPVGNSLLYGRWLNLPTQLSYSFPGIGVFITAFPGIVMLLLGLLGIFVGRKLNTSPHLRAATAALLSISLVGFLLSFGANNEVFGKNLAPVLDNLLPYPYLYRALPVLHGFRIPLRFALLTTFGLAVLAGIGFAGIAQALNRKKQIVFATLLVSVFALAEHLPAPLPGQQVPHGKEVYSWLADNTDEDAVILELPYYLHTKQNHKEAVREYESTRHWRQLVNGGSGFKPEWLVNLGETLDTFPNWAAFDVAQQLGVNYIVLHSDQYSPTDWNNLMGLLPAYYPAIKSIISIENQVILQLKQPECVVSNSDIEVDASSFPTLGISNNGVATWITNPNRTSTVDTITEHTGFLEPLFVLPSQQVRLTLPIENLAAASSYSIWLANLDRTVTQDSTQSQLNENTFDSIKTNEYQVYLPFSNEATLETVQIDNLPKTCSILNVNLEWVFNPYTNQTVEIELVDQFGRLIMSDASKPVEDNMVFVSHHKIPLPQTLPAGQYQIRVRLLTEDKNTPITNVNSSEELPTLPITIHPQETDPDSTSGRISQFANNMALHGIVGPQTEITVNEWVRFTLIWKAAETVADDFTVFTQLIDSNGKIWGQYDNPPKGGRYPTSAWILDELIEDDYAIKVDPDTPPGQYQLLVGMYNSTSGERAIITDGVNQGQDFVTVTTVKIK